MRINIGKRSYTKYAFIAGVLAATAPSAHATTINFAFYDGATLKASGSFDFTSANATLYYADLTSFSLTIGTASYNLAYALAASDYSYFAFDTIAEAFIPGGVSGCYGGPFNVLLSAVNNCFASGYFVKPAADNAISEFTQSIYNTPYTTVTYEVVPTNGDDPPSRLPEPASIFLLGAGLLGMGLVRRRK